MRIHQVFSHVQYLQEFQKKKNTNKDILQPLVSHFLETFAQIYTFETTKFQSSLFFTRILNNSLEMETHGVDKQRNESDLVELWGTTGECGPLL